MRPTARMLRPSSRQRDPSAGFRRPPTPRPRMLICCVPRKRWPEALVGAEAALPSSPEGDVAAVGSPTPRTLCGPAAASFSSSSTCSPRVEEVVTAAGGRGDGGWRKEAAACVAWSPEGRCCWSCAVSWRRPVAAGRCPGSATTSPSASTGPAPSSLWSVPSLAAATSPFSGTKHSAQSSVFLAFPSRSFFFF